MKTKTILAFLLIMAMQGLFLSGKSFAKDLAPALIEVFDMVKISNTVLSKNEFNLKAAHTKQSEDFLSAGGQNKQLVTTSLSAPSVKMVGRVVHLLAVYTPKAKASASGRRGIEAKITEAVAMANQSYISNKMDIQINLVGISETYYNETGDISVSIDDLAHGSDGKMDEVPTLMNQYGADQVSLFTTDPNYCGIGHLAPQSGPNDQLTPFALSVVHDDPVFVCRSNQAVSRNGERSEGRLHNIYSSL